MNRRVNRRTVTITIVSTLLLALLATAAVARVFSLAPLARQVQTIRQNPNGDAGVAAAAPAGAPTSGSTARDAVGDTTVAGLREFLGGEGFAGTNRTSRGFAETGPQEFLPGDGSTRSLPIVRRGVGVGPIEYLPGEEPSVIPSLAPSREAAPDFGPQP